MNERKLTLAFKGGRNYVHGTTMLDETTRLLSDSGYTRLNDIEFLIHRMTDTNLELALVPGNENGAASADDVAVMRFVVDGRPLQVRIRSIEGVPDLRLPYDESLVVDRC